MLFNNVLISTSFLTTIAAFPLILGVYGLPKLLVVSLGSGILLAIIIMSARKLDLTYFRKILILVLLYIISLLLVSIFSDQSLESILFGAAGRYNGLLSQVFYLILFVAALLATNIEKKILNSLVLIGILNSIYGIFQVNGADFILANNKEDKLILLATGNTNFSALILAFTFISSCYVFLSTKQLNLKIPIFISLLTHIFLMYHLDAIQVYFYLTLGLCLLGLFLLIEKKLYRLAKIFASMIFLSFVTVVLGLLSFGPFSSVFQKSSFIDRKYTWFTAIEIFKDNILFGFGLDSFAYAYPLYRTNEIIEFRNLTFTSYVNNAHNFYLQSAATGGLILLVSFTLINFYVALRIIPAMKKADNKFLTGSIVCIWGCYQLNSMISVENSSTAVWGWICAGTIVRMSFIDKDPGFIHTKSSKQFFNLNLLSSILIFLSPFFYVLFQVISSYEFNQSIVLLRESNTKSDVLIHSSRIVELSKRVNDAGTIREGIVDLGKFGEIESAVYLANQIILKHPNSILGWDAMAQIYENTGQGHLAVKFREKTTYLDPLNTDFKKLLELDMSLLKSYKK